MRGKEGKYGLYEREGVCKRLKREKKNLLNTKGGRGKNLDKDLGYLYQSFGIDSFPLCFLCFAARTDFSGVGWLSQFFAAQRRVCTLEKTIGLQRISHLKGPFVKTFYWSYVDSWTFLTKVSKSKYLFSFDFRSVAFISTNICS